MRTCPTFFFILLFFFSQTNINAQPKAILEGSVKSLDGTSLPRAHVILKPYTENLFYNSQVAEVDDEDRFQIPIPRSGVYRLTVRGAMHKSINLPIWIREPDTLVLDINLDPRNLDDGEYFDSNEYISWIRVTGNFNGYNYDRGVRFERVAPKTLRAVINTSLDTLHYQITGLTSGTTVLPGAADYRLRDSQNYEAIVPVKGNKVVLTYHADSTYFDNKNPFEGYRTTWDPNQSKVQFSDKLEGRIHSNLKNINLFSRLFNYSMFDSDSLSRDMFEYTMEQHYRKSWEFNIDEIKAMESHLQNIPTGTDGALRQSMYYKYLILAKVIHDSHNSRLLEGSNTEPSRYIDAGVLRASMEAIPPESPLWSLRKDLTYTLPKTLGYTKEVTGYLEQVVMKNPDNDVTGRVLFGLFTNSYDKSGRSEETQNYYRLILEAFGDNYYARKAREYVQSNN